MHLGLTQWEAKMLLTIIEHYTARENIDAESPMAQFLFMLLPRLKILAGGA